MEKIDSFKGDYFFLSNFYNYKLNYNGLRYNSVEAAFQAQKCPSRSAEFCNLSPSEAKHLGRRVMLRNDWEDIKISVMRDLLKIKFSNPYLKQKLLDTGDAELIEGNTWNDRFWGVCRGKGENHLGQLLEEIRTFYK